MPLEISSKLTIFQLGYISSHYVLKIIMLGLDTILWNSKLKRNPQVYFRQLPMKMFIFAFIICSFTIAWKENSSWANPSQINYATMKVR